jgi:hypothetical protein
MNTNKETITLLVPEDSEFAKESANLRNYTRAQIAAAALSKLGYPAKGVNGSEFQCVISRIDTRFGEIIHKMGLIKKPEKKEDEKVA